MSSGIRRPAREGDTLFPHNVDFKNEWSYTSTHSCAFLTCTGPTLRLFMSLTACSGLHAALTALQHWIPSRLVSTFLSALDSLTKLHHGNSLVSFCASYSRLIAYDMYSSLLVNISLATRFNPV